MTSGTDTHGGHVYNWMFIHNVAVEAVQETLFNIHFEMRQKANSAAHMSHTAHYSNTNITDSSPGQDRKIPTVNHWDGRVGMLCCLLCLK